MSILKLMGIFVFVVFTGCVDERVTSPKFDDDSQNLLENWQYRWGDSPFNSYGAPVWTLEDLNNKDWIDQDFAIWPQGKPENSHNMWQRVRLPLIEGESQQLFLPQVWKSFEVYMEGQKIYSYGTFSDDGSANFKGKLWHVIPLKSRYSYSYLNLRFYSNDAYIGANAVAIIASKSSHIQRIIKDDLILIVLASTYIFMGAISIFFWIMNRKELSAVSFGLFTLSIGIYGYSRTNIRELFLNDPVFWEYAELLPMYFSPCFLGMFSDHIFGGRKFNIYRFCWVVDLSYCLYVVMSLVFVSGSSAWDFLYNWQYLVILLSLFLTVNMGLSAFRGNREGKVFFTGIFILCMTAVHDILIAIGLFEGFGVIIHFGLFVMICSLAQVVGARILQSVSIKKNLELASSVQELLLPSDLGGTFHDYEYSSKYEPFGRMAGDWMNYWHDSEGEKRLMFGDVVGKGPRAALAVAAISAFIDSSEVAGDSIEECIKRINNGLLKLFDGQLTTTFSAIHLKDNDIVDIYNCGGVGWTKISDNGYIYYTLRSSVLGMSEAIIIGHQAVEVKEGEVLFAFTDGVMEGTKNISRMIKGLKTESLKNISLNDFFTRVQSYNNVPAEDDRSILAVRKNTKTSEAKTA